MKLIVVTPTLGESPYLELTVNSVTAFSSNECVIEHIIVTPKRFVDDLRIKYPHCRVLGEESRGMYSAINQGLLSVAGPFDFWTYINDDDHLLSSFSGVITRALKSLSVNGECVIYGDVVIIDHLNQIKNSVTRWRCPFFMKGALSGKRSPLNQQGALWSYATLSKVGYFDPLLKYASDYDYFFRCAMQGVTFHYVNARVAAYRVHANQLGQNGEAFIVELVKVRARYKVNSFYSFACACLFILLNWDIYVWRLIRRKPFGKALFKHIS